MIKIHMKCSLECSSQPFYFIVSGMFGTSENEPNPWVVSRFEDFRSFCCPECDFKHKKKRPFIAHTSNHPRSEVLEDSLDVQNGSSSGNTKTKQESDEDFNPWIVASLDAFKFYCCPECDKRCVTKAFFIGHAVTHSRSSGFFESLDVIVPRIVNVRSLPDQESNIEISVENVTSVTVEQPIVQSVTNDQNRPENVTSVTSAVTETSQDSDDDISIIEVVTKKKDVTHTIKQTVT